MNSSNTGEAAARDGGSAQPAERADDAPTLGDAASDAERQFVERVRSDRARARTLLRRFILIGIVLVSAIAMLVVARGILSSPNGGHVPSTGALVTAPPRPGGEALEQRVGRLEGRVGALENRATVGERRAQRPASVTPAATPPSAVQSRKAPASRSPTVTAAARRPQPAAQSLTIGERFRRGWDAIEGHVRRTPDDVRKGVNKLKRLFAD